MHKKNIWKTGWCLLYITTVIFIAASSSNAQKVSWKSTTEQNPWVDKGSVPISEWDNDQTNYIEINKSIKYQEIDGWGGALNELGWVALSVLADEEKNKVLNALFDTSGCAINIGRISIGANDYSLSHYSCSETPNDFSMEHFSLDKEKINIIPFCLAAKKINPSMKFWGSPHSPPAWMKQNNSMVDGSLKTDTATRKAYALYFQKWVQGMASENIPIYAVHIQNEPNISGVGYPTCVMSGAEMGILIRDYIGPQFKNAGLTTEIWAGTLHSDRNFDSFYPEYIPPTLGDPVANAFISGVGMQWNAISDASKVTQNYPSKRTMQTEVECGNFNWNAGYNKDFPPNDWGYGIWVFQRMMEWFRNGVNAYCQWNMVLDETGKSNSLNGPWPQNSMISINKTTKEIRYNPHFYAVKHFSNYVKPGARRVETTGNYSTGGSNLTNTNLGLKVTDGDMMAFLNPDGSIALVMRNSSSTEKSVAIRLGSLKFKPTIPANSFNTFLITNYSATLKDMQTPKSQNISVRMNSGSVTFSIANKVNLRDHNVSLSITDVSGRVIKELSAPSNFDKVSFEWNLKNESGIQVVPGVYLARIKSGSETMIHAFALPR
jgi:glucosylceramidase